MPEERRVAAGGGPDEKQPPAAEDQGSRECAGGDLIDDDATTLHAPLEPEQRQTDGDAVVRVEVDAATALLEPGERYRRVEEIGCGGVGVIDAVWDPFLCRLTAKKIVRPDVFAENLTPLLVAEAQITGQLDHPNVVPVYDLGVEADGRVFFTMRIVDGVPLSQMLRSLPTEPLSRSQLFDLLEIVVKVCDALSFAHSRGVVHLDVKPENVMVGEYGQVYLMDWGLARSIGIGTERAVAHEGSVVGTPSYMAPEQAVGGTVDTRTDVFAIGALLYAVVARRAPYKADTLAAALSTASRGERPPLRQVAPGGEVPRELALIIDKAMARSREDRYPSAELLRRDLVQFMRGGGEFEQRSYAAGEHIVRDGEHGEEAFIVRSGKAEVYKMIEGERRTLRLLGPGDCFGETAVLSASPRVASVVASEPTTVSVLTKEALDGQMSRVTPWMLSLVRSVAERFREGEEQRAGTRTIGTADELAEQLLMYLTTWGKSSGDGSLRGSWRAVESLYESLFSRAEQSWAERLASLPDIEIDLAEDRATLTDPDGLRRRLQRRQIPPNS